MNTHCVIETAAVAARVGDLRCPAKGAPPAGEGGKRLGPA
jgi:hypothetical protein